MHEIRFRLGLRADSARGAHSAPPDHQLPHPRSRPSGPRNNLPPQILYP